ncbi:acyl carrier protein [uncultured Croceitalea sp.]|uniref:acyl carrier protein n=1 Tax=uncultured Croceitalea sp. TaxID=1798908 RepID=UPI003305F6AE
MEDFNEAIAQILEVENIELSNELSSFDAWDSLTILSIIAFCYSDYGVTLSAEEVSNSETVLGLKKLIETKM